MTDYKQIVWLASYPKSGNTWIRCFLDAYFLNELDLNDIVTSVTDDIVGLYQPGDSTDISKAPIDIQHLCRPMALLRLVNMHNNTRGNNLPLFVKTHSPHLIANGVEYLPESLTKCVIYIVRDPRDVLPSFSKHMGKNVDTGLEWMQDKYRTLGGTDRRTGELISSWDNHVLSYIHADTHNVHYIRYEDLLNDPEQYFKKILEHSGITPDLERIRKAIDLTQLEKLKEKEQKEGFRESSPFAKNEFFGDGGTKGRDKLQPKHLYRIEKAFGRVMKKLNYIAKKVAA